MNDVSSPSDLEALLSALPETPWQPMDMAPKDGTAVLIYDAGIQGWPAQIKISLWEPRHQVHGFGGTYTTQDRWRDVKAATRWMPLPAPPPPSEEPA
jgi:hypothetical protein